ncbi:DNA mismatch repair protein [Pseudobacter ginsenosidimutans]|nr:DNA mismatch repair protein [Pseudobacter ginsenosidimutans]
MLIIRNEGILEKLEKGTKRAGSAVINGSFHADRQTVDELNLLGKFRHGSVYHLFGQVKTRGAEQLLDEMFRHPLTDPTAINNRSAIFKFFQEAGLQFPFDVQQLTLMREFLDTGSGQSAGTVLLNTMLRKMLAGLTRDERYKKSVQGLQATIVTLNKCFQFLPSLNKIQGGFAARVQSISDLLHHPQLEKLRNTDIYAALSVRSLAHFDHLLKRSFATEMEDVLRFIHELDLFISVSDMARTRGFTYAKALPANQNCFRVKNLSHPCLPNAIGNDIVLEENSNVLFLTGANMAGKSTLMKSIGIGLYLGHMGFPVSVTDMEFSVREGLYSSINVADNIGLGYSHFYAEVVRVKQAADAASSGKRLFMMFDELFKGTNVKDAFDGTLSVTQAFAGYPDCLFIVSTHIIEVGELLKNRKNVRFSFMPTVMDGHRPRYTYRMQQGITEDRQGMMIIRNEGLLEQLHA